MTLDVTLKTSCIHGPKFLDTLYVVWAQVGAISELRESGSST
jgi:hypothetical protein